MSVLHDLARSEREAHLERRHQFHPRRPRAIRPFLPAGEGESPRLIAEFKRSSPSAGPLPHRDLPDMLRHYEDIGASAISVLVAREGFSGSLDDLRTASMLSPLPVLYKGFVVEPGQVLEAYAYGADAVLLIVALLGERLQQFAGMAQELGLRPLCEVHDEAEMAIARSAGVDLIGVNNRDLGSLRVDLDNFPRLARLAPAQADIVAESGYRTSQSVREAAEAGASALLIGEALLRGELADNWNEVRARVG